MSRTTALLALAACLLAAAPALADVVHLKDGRRVEGATRWTPEGLRVEVPGGSLLVPRDQVLRVEERETPWEAFDRRRADLGTPLEDLDAAAELAAFGLDHGLGDEARALLLEAVGRDPEHAGAGALLRDRLDFHREEGRWVPPEVWYPARGYVQLNGQWVPPEEAQRVAAARDKRQAVREASSAEQELRAADRALERAAERFASAEERLSVAVARVEHYENEEGRITALLTDARREEAARREELAGLEQSYLLARRAYDGWIASPCGCQTTCACGWDRRRGVLWNTCELAHQRLGVAVRELRRAEEQVRALGRDLAEAQRRRVAAERELARARAEHVTAEREQAERADRIARAERKLEAAEERIGDAEQRMDDAAAAAARRRIQAAPVIGDGGGPARGAGADAGPRDGREPAGPGGRAEAGGRDSRGAAQGPMAPPFLAALRGFAAGASANPADALAALEDVRRRLRAGDLRGEPLRDALVSVHYLAGRALPAGEAEAATGSLPKWLHEAEATGAVGPADVAAAEEGLALASRQVVALAVLERIAAAQERFLALQLQAPRYARDLAELVAARLIEGGLDAGADGYAYLLRGAGARWLAVATPQDPDAPGACSFAVDRRGRVHFAPGALGLTDDLAVPAGATPVPAR